VNTAAGGSVSTLQQIVFPEKIHGLLRRGPVHPEIDYSLTLFRWRTLDTITALGGDKRIARFGWCKTQIDQDGDEIQFCVSRQALPQHASAWNSRTLETAVTMAKTAYASRTTRRTGCTSIPRQSATLAEVSGPATQKGS
jgi:hypothetical protein